jgi:hypothetical protein
MAFRVNYNQARNDRKRAKEAKKQERLARRAEDAEKRKGGRDDQPAGDSNAGPTVDTASIPDAPKESE